MHKNIKISISIVFFIQINTCTHLYINANQILMCVDFFTRNVNGKDPRRTQAWTWLLK